MRLNILLLVLVVAEVVVVVVGFKMELFKSFHSKTPHFEWSGVKTAFQSTLI